MGWKLIEKIYVITKRGNYAHVVLKDGYEFLCKADCFGEEEDTTPNLRVEKFGKNLVQYGSEILIDDDIETVEEYNPNN